ncbi:CehA/McbA family metallohydrolase [Rugosimonospora acidiphila]
MELSRRQLMAISGGTVVAATGLTATPAFASAADADGAKKPDGPGRQAPKGVWLAGDTHVHDDHSSDGSLPRQESGQTLPGNLPVADQIGQGERTDLDFMPLTDHRTYDQQWDPGWQSSKLLLIPGEEANGSPHAIVLGAVDTIVDGANPAGSAAFRHVQQSVWDAHAQNAIWSVAHPDDGEYTPEDGPNDNASVQGMNTVEVYNVASDPDAEIDYAENRWNRGFRFGVTAASDCHFRELWGIAGPGQPTTYVFAAQRSVRGILDGLRAGRTTVSVSRTGPFVTLEADVDGDGVFEAMGGDEVIVNDDRLPHRASLRVRIQSGAGTTVRVYASPGRSAGPVATVTPSAADETHLVPIRLTGAQTWYRVEVRAPGAASGAEADPTLPDQLRAATSPVFISVKRPADPRPELPLPAPARGDDRASVALGEDGGFAGFADVAVRDGVAHVVAEVHDGSSTTVVYRQVPPHGQPAKPVTLSGDSATARSPRVAVSGRDVWVVWADERGQEQPHRSSIYLRHSRNGGHSFDPETRLTHGTGRAIHPAIALLDAEHPVVAWADNTGGAFDVYAQVVGLDRDPANLSATGKTTSPGDGTDARSARFPASLFPSVAVGRDGRVLVAWQDDRFDPDPLWTGHTPAPGQAPSGTDPDNWQILASTRPERGQGWGAPVQVSAVTTMADRHPSVLADAEGAFVAVWESSALQSSGANIGLRYGRSTDGGKTWSPFQTVAPDPDAMSQRPRLSLDPDRSVRVVWYDTRAADWRWKVFTARLDVHKGWTAPTQLSIAGNGTWPAADQGVVVFTSDRQARRTQRDWTQQIYLLQAH